ADTAPTADSTFSSTVPSPTLSPTCTSTSLTTPAALDGTSMVALSDSRVQIASSTLMLSPGFTNSSITGTASKSPMSGTLTSTRLMAISLQHDATEVAQQLRGIDVESRRERAVDDPVVRRQGHRQHQARHEGLAVPDRFHCRLVHAED